MKWLLTPLLTALLGGGTFWFTPKPAPSTPHSLQEQADSVPGSAFVWLGLDFTGQLRGRTPLEWLNQQRAAHPGLQSMLDKWEASTGVKADELAQAVGSGGYLALLPKGAVPLVDAQGEPQMDAVLVLAVGDFARARALSERLSGIPDLQVVLTPGALYLGNSPEVISEARLAVEQHSHTLGQTTTFKEAAVQLPGLAQAGGSVSYINAQPVWKALAPMMPTAVAAELEHFPYYAAAVQPQGDGFVAETFFPIRRTPETALTRALLQAPRGAAPMARWVPTSWGYYGTSQLFYTVDALKALLGLVSTDDEFLASMLERARPIQNQLQAAFTGEAGFALNLSRSLDDLSKNIAPVNDLSACRSNCRNAAVALEMYATDYGGHYPASMEKLVAGSYLSSLPTCPAASRDTYSASYQVSTQPELFSFACSGNNHALGDNIPRYSSETGFNAGGTETAAETPATPWEGVMLLPVRDLARAHQLEKQLLDSGFVEAQTTTVDGHPVTNATAMGSPYSWTWLERPNVLAISSGPTAQQNLAAVLATASQPIGQSLAGQPGFAALQKQRTTGQAPLATYYVDQNALLNGLAQLLAMDEDLGMLSSALRAFTSGAQQTTTALVEVEDDGIRMRGTGQGMALAGAGGLAAAMLIPNFVESRSAGQLTACKSNEKNIATALEMYCVDNAGLYPPELKKLTEGSYLRTMPTCPAAGIDTYSGSYERNSKADAFSFCCYGHNHPAIPSDHPRYDSVHGLSEFP